jgi:hypothetical protein
MKKMMLHRDTDGTSALTARASWLINLNFNVIPL